MDKGYCMREKEGNFEILQTLHDIPGQTAGTGQNLENSAYLGPFQGQTAGHDQADITGTENDSAFARHQPLHIDEPLHCAGGVDTGGTVSRKGYLETTALAAAHCQDHGSGFQFKGFFPVCRF